jgi:hypothetical protein
MKVRLTVMIQKQSNNHCIGRAHNQQEQKRCGRSKIQQRARHFSFFLFLTWRGSFTMNLFLLTLLSTLTLTVTFWDAWGKMCNERDRNFCATTTGTITTMHLPICPWKPEFVTNNNMFIIHHPPYSLGLAPCDFTSFLKLKTKLKRRRFETVSDIQKGITSGTWQY